MAIFLRNFHFYYYFCTKDVQKKKKTYKTLIQMKTYTLFAAILLCLMPYMVEA